MYYNIRITKPGRTCGLWWHPGGGDPVVARGDAGVFHHAEYSDAARQYEREGLVEFVPVADEPVAEVSVSSESSTRKGTPVWAGVLRYFPDAVCAIARLSKAGNDKHNPGEPLHWSRGKSNDHGDCLMRHQLTPELVDDETGELHAVSVAWRALAQLQLLEEKRLGAASLGAQLGLCQ